jgi:hypothetical protein
MFFPWIGLFEQIQLADVYCHLGNVKAPKQSFIYRVQLKGPNGSFWWIVPLNKNSSDQEISKIKIDLSDIWIKKSLTTLTQIFSKTPHLEDIISLFESVISSRPNTLYELNVTIIETIAHYFELKKKFIHYNDIPNNEIDPSRRVLKIIEDLHGTEYVSGLGGKNYLDTKLFENHHIPILYMNYQNVPYAQKYGDFNPYVSILHLIAAEGKLGKKKLISQGLPERKIL